MSGRRKTLNQPPRGPADGAVSVRRLRDQGTVEIAVTTNGKSETMTISEYNAFRLFGLLGFMLDIPLSKAAGEIEM